MQSGARGGVGHGTVGVRVESNKRKKSKKGQKKAEVVKLDLPMVEKESSAEKKPALRPIPLSDVVSCPGNLEYYIETLKIFRGEQNPEEEDGGKPMNLLITGEKGSGKSTLAQAVAFESGLPVLDLEDLQQLESLEGPSIFILDVDSSEEVEKLVSLLGRDPNLILLGCSDQDISGLKDLFQLKVEMRGHTAKSLKEVLLGKLKRLKNYEFQGSLHSLELPNNLTTGRLAQYLSLVKVEAKRGLESVARPVITPEHLEAAGAKFDGLPFNTEVPPSYYI